MRGEEMRGEERRGDEKRVAERRRVTKRTRCGPKMSKSPRVSKPVSSTCLPYLIINNTNKKSYKKINDINKIKIKY